MAPPRRHKLRPPRDRLPPRHLGRIRLLAPQWSPYAHLATYIRCRRHRSERRWRNTLFRRSTLSLRIQDSPHLHHLLNCMACLASTLFLRHVSRLIIHPEGVILTPKIRSLGVGISTPFPPHASATTANSASCLPPSPSYPTAKKGSQTAWRRIPMASFTVETSKIMLLAFSIPRMGL